MANVRKVQVVTPAAAPTQAYADAERKRALADELRKRSMAPRDMSAMQGSDPYLLGLTQLGEALIARYAGKGASQAEGAADAQMRDVNAAAIEKLAGPYQIESVDVGGEGAPLAGGSLPGSEIQAALAGTDPRQANQIVSQALLQRAIPDKQEQTVLPYGARLVGKDGQLIAENNRIPGAAANSGDMQWLQRYMEANPNASFAEAAAAHAQYKRSMQPDRPPDPVTLATVASPTAPAGIIKDARTGRVIGDAVPNAATAAAGQKANGRVAALDAARIALNRVQSTSDTLGSGGGFIEGRLPAMGEKTQDFDGAVAQLLAAIQSALRVPGIGSQSNMELQALMNALPLRTQEKKVRDNQITGIANRLEAIIARESAIQDSAAPPSAAKPKETAAERAKRLGL